MSLIPSKALNEIEIKRFCKDPKSERTNPKNKYSCLKFYPG